MIIDKVYLNDVIIHEIHVLERRITTISLQMIHRVRRTTYIYNLCPLINELIMAPGPTAPSRCDSSSGRALRQHCRSHCWSPVYA